MNLDKLLKNPKFVLFVKIVTRNLNTESGPSYNLTKNLEKVYNTILCKLKFTKLMRKITK